MLVQYRYLHMESKFTLDEHVIECFPQLVEGRKGRGREGGRELGMCCTDPVTSACACCSSKVHVACESQQELFLPNIL